MVTAGPWAPAIMAQFGVKMPFEFSVSAAIVHLILLVDARISTCRGCLSSIICASVNAFLIEHKRMCLYHLSNVAFVDVVYIIIFMQLLLNVCTADKKGGGVLLEGGASGALLCRYLSVRHTVR